MNDSQAAGDDLLAACPHCGGPLRVASAAFECAAGHVFTPVQVRLEQARTSARAAWQAVRALEERAEMTRRIADDPELYRIEDPDALAEAARTDQETASTLRRYAEALDRTLGGAGRLLGSSGD